MSRARVAWLVLLALASLLLIAPAGWTEKKEPDKAKEKEKTKKVAVADLKLEVEALQLIYHFKMNRDQLKLLKGFAKETSEKARDRNGRTTDEFYQDLLDYHGALLDASDEDLIDSLEEQVSQREETEEPDIDEDWQITDSARKKLPEFLKTLKVPQIAKFLENEAEIDPADQMIEGLSQSRTFNKKKWPDRRDEIANYVADTSAGIDAKKHEQVKNQVVALLSKARGMKDEEYKEKREELEKSAREVVAGLDAMDALKNLRDHRVAKLLSNPRLAEAVEARLQK